MQSIFNANYYSLMFPPGAGLMGGPPPMSSGPPSMPDFPALGADPPKGPPSMGKSSNPMSSMPPLDLSKSDPACLRFTHHFRVIEWALFNQSFENKSLYGLACWWCLFHVGLACCLGRSVCSGPLLSDMPFFGKIWLKVNCAVLSGPNSVHSWKFTFFAKLFFCGLLCFLFKQT